MRDLSLLNIDMNLLVAFDALVVEGHVSRAAAKVGISQPAMSRSLKQLREIFGDSLFRRTSEGMVPTPRAVELARLIRPGLETIATAIGKKGGFDPATSRRRFVIAMPDMAAHLALPAIVSMLEREAPNIDLVVIHVGNHDALAKVENGQVELALGVYDYLPPGIMSHNVRSLREVCIADRRNPAIHKEKISLDRFLSLPHVAVEMTGDHGLPIDTTLEVLGLRRRVAVSVPHFLAVPRLIIGSGMIAVAAEDLLDALPEGALLARCKVPVPLDPVMAKLVWHRRAEEDLGHQWFRALTIKAVTAAPIAGTAYASAVYL